MKYLSFDGKVFDDAADCILYEKNNKLISYKVSFDNHINENICTTYCDDAGFSIIEPENVMNYILGNFDVISDFVNKIEKVDCNADEYLDEGYSQR
jgi:hypothetical protein